MAVNLRLRSEAEAALRAEAERTGRSQQEILREAVDRHLQAVADGGSTSLYGREPLYASGAVLPPRTPYRRTTPTLTLPAGRTSLDLLERDDRL
jgi:hypothetical protein